MNYSEANLGVVRSPIAMEKLVGPVAINRVSVGKLVTTDAKFGKLWMYYNSLPDQTVALQLEKRHNYPGDGISRLIKAYMPEYGKAFYISGVSQVFEVASKLLLLGLEKKIKPKYFEIEADLGHPLVDIALAVNQMKTLDAFPFRFEPTEGHVTGHENIVSEAKESLLWIYVFVGGVGKEEVLRRKRT